MIRGATHRLPGACPPACDRTQRGLDQLYVVAVRASGDGACAVKKLPTPFVRLLALLYSVFRLLLGALVPAPTLAGRIVRRYRLGGLGSSYVKSSVELIPERGRAVFSAPPEASGRVGLGARSR